MVAENHKNEKPIFKTNMRHKDKGRKEDHTHTWNENETLTERVDEVRQSVEEVEDANKKNRSNK